MFVFISKGLQFYSSLTKNSSHEGLKERFYQKQIVISKTITEQMNTFDYLGCSVSFQNEKDVNAKSTMFLQIVDWSTDYSSLLRSSRTQGK